MCNSRIFYSIASLLWASAAAAQSPSPSDIQQIADTMVRLCIGGGSTRAIAGTATGGADISLRSLDVKGNLSTEFKINKSSAEGLVNGIDNALTQVAADQADRVRDCLRPVRERLLDVLLPTPLAPPRSEYDPVSTVRAFYVALSRADGRSAEALVVPEKRGIGNFKAENMSEFYSSPSSLRGPLRILSIERTRDDFVNVKYRFIRQNGSVCLGDAEVNTIYLNGKALIQGISTNC
jgi:hypothetical protein